MTILIQFLDKSFGVGVREEMSWKQVFRYRPGDETEGCCPPGFLAGKSRGLAGVPAGFEGLDKAKRGGWEGSLCGMNRRRRQRKEGCSWCSVVELRVRHGDWIWSKGLTSFPVLLSGCVTSEPPIQIL